MMKWATSDLHFGHKNIAHYEGRISDWERLAVRRWNESVAPGDVVYVLGDFSFYNVEDSRRIMALLNGHKILITGNHDDTESRMLRMGFIEVHGNRKNIHYGHRLTSMDGRELVLSHAPLTTMHMDSIDPDWRMKGVLNLHGHVHSKPYCKLPHNINVGVDVHYFKPVPLVWEMGLQWLK